MGAAFSTPNETPKEGYTSIAPGYLILFAILGILGLIFILRIVVCPNNRKTK